MTTCLGKSCSFGLPRMRFVNCCQFMYLVVSLLVLMAGYGIWWCQFLSLLIFLLYKGLVRPVLDYGSSVWDPPGVVLQEELESVQKRAARFVTGNYNYETGSMTGILWQLKWEFLKKNRKDNRFVLPYKDLKGKASVPTDELIPKIRRCRNQHSTPFQTPIANTDVYKGSFFPRLSAIGMLYPILWSYLLKMQRICC